MPWLRLDDKFATHPKIAALTDREFRVHIRVLCYCALHRTDGHLSDSIWTEIVGLTRQMGDKFLTLGLWDRDRRTKRLSVHDFPAYNPKDPTAPERMQRYRLRQGDDRVTAPVTTEPLAGAGARPVPSPNPQEQEEQDLSAVPRGTTDGLPFSKERLTVELLAAVAEDADEQTAVVVRRYADKLPEGSLAKVLESVRHAAPRDRAAYAVGALRGEVDQLRAARA